MSSQTGGRFGTVTVKVTVSDRLAWESSGLSVAVTVTVAVPTATPVTVTLLPSFDTVTLLGFEETAV